MRRLWLLVTTRSWRGPRGEWGQTPSGVSATCAATVATFLEVRSARRTAAGSAHRVLFFHAGVDRDARDEYVPPPPPAESRLSVTWKKGSTLYLLC